MNTHFICFVPSSAPGSGPSQEGDGVRERSQAAEVLLREAGHTRLVEEGQAVRVADCPPPHEDTGRGVRRRPISRDGQGAQGGPRCLHPSDVRSDGVLEVEADQQAQGAVEEDRDGGVVGVPMPACCCFDCPYQAARRSVPRREPSRSRTATAHLAGLREGGRPCRRSTVGVWLPAHGHVCQPARCLAGKEASASDNDCPVREEGPSPSDNTARPAAGTSRRLGLGR